MNYLEIIINGYFNETLREFLDDYFIAEAKKEKYIKADIFFKGCLNVIEDLEEQIQIMVNDRVNELELMLQLAKENNIKQTINYYNNELKNIREDGVGSTTFTINLYSLTNGTFTGILYYADIQKIKSSLLEAKKENEPLPPQQTKTKKTTATTIALFCNLINDVEIIKRENNEIPEKYCKRICEIYSLKYTDRVRQNFNGNKSKNHYKELTELILPCIDVTTKDIIQKHLDSKNPPKQKLYA